MASDKRKGAGIWRYLKEAFTFKWNLLFFGGAVAAGVLSGRPDVVLPLVGAAELAYLAGLTSLPRYQAAIDAKARHQDRALGAGTTTSGAEDTELGKKKIGDLLGGLGQDAKVRFLRLRARCVEMRRIADAVRGKADGDDRTDELRTPALDKLLWTFLRLLYAQQALAKFLEATDEASINKTLEGLRAREKAATERNDERILRSLKDSIATAEVRLENYQKSKGNAEFVSVELDRIEGKIQALTEMAISHQDPDDIAHQVDAVADGMAHTEQTIRDLQTLTGMSGESENAPSILEADLTEVVQ
jgi:DNA-binding FrmR family transcriptional regulator